MCIIETDRLSFSYGRVPVLSGVSLSISRGSFCALTGPNGAGKSTLLRLLLGELSTGEGNIRLLGQDVSLFRRWPQIGYVPQNGLSNHMDFPASVNEIVQANLYSQTSLFHFYTKGHRDQVFQALSTVGMDGYGKRLIGELSGGQRQRVMLAKALVSNPEIMILDEPTTGVDESGAEAFYHLLSDLNRTSGLTILMVTHDVCRACSFATQVLRLENGTLKEETKPNGDF